MSYLKRFPLDALKIDQSFVCEIHSSEDSHSICKAIVALGHGLGMKIIAEGVEHHEQLQLLHMMGCDQIQGYYFAKPMPAEEVRNFINERKDRRVTRLPLANQ
jgi:EAL domain-containing protein (putative c-di-GMP-specific phosphodiesterase class I)